MFIFFYLGHTALHCGILAHGRPQRNGPGYINSLPIIEALIKAGADPNSQVSGSINKQCLVTDVFPQYDT